MSCYAQCGCLVPVGVTKINGLNKKEKEALDKVFSRGGNKNAQLLVTLEWFSYSDLDLNVVEPDNKSRVWYKIKKSINNGELDVDANAGSYNILTPVENISYKVLDKMVNGKYTVYVNLFKNRVSSETNNHFNIYIFFKKKGDTVFTKVAKLSSINSLDGKGNDTKDDDIDTLTKIATFIKTDDNIILESIEENTVNVELLYGIEYIMENKHELYN